MMWEMLKVVGALGLGIVGMMFILMAILNVDPNDHWED